MQRKLSIVWLLAEFVSLMFISHSMWRVLVKAALNRHELSHTPKSAPGMPLMFNLPNILTIVFLSILRPVSSRLRIALRAIVSDS